MKLLLILLLMGCAAPVAIIPEPFSRMSECRHRAVECALVYGDPQVGAKVGIASGPVLADPKNWHAQAFVRNPDSPSVNKAWKWIINKGFACELGEKEPFLPERYDTVDTFLTWQFSNID